LKNKLMAIHESSMKILENTGIKLQNPEVLKIIREKGVKVLGQTAFFNREQIMKWVSKAPKDFTIYARNPKYNMFIGGENTEYAAGYGCTDIIETDGKRRKAIYSDYLNFLKLVHQCNYFNINGGILVQPLDLDVNQSSLIMIYSTITHSDKCIMGVPARSQNMQKIMDILSIFFGQKDLMEKPRILILVSTTSPLQISKDTLDMMLISIKYNQPLLISPGPLAGATGPISLGGNIALGNAETLAGIAIAQMIKEGTPVIYALQAEVTDMKTGNNSIGSPGCALQSVYCARLAKMYNLPSRSGGTYNDAKGVSVQSGYESMLAMFTACQEKVNFILHSNGILDGFGAMSYEQFIVDLEIISMIKYYLKDIKIDNNSLAVGLINKVGPGGEFLTTEHTLRNCRTEPWMSKITSRAILQNETETPNDRILISANKKQKEMIGNYQKPELDKKIKSRLDKYMKSNGIDLGFINKL
jgi:trimethylamine--corrinoid protein Co-methyltransferase